jgi:hypothetical protein
LQTKEQKADLQFVMPDFGSNIDYVCAWYKKAAELMANSKDVAREVNPKSWTDYKNSSLNLTGLVLSLSFILSLL